MGIKEKIIKTAASIAVTDAAFKVKNVFDDFNYYPEVTEKLEFNLLQIESKYPNRILIKDDYAYNSQRAVLFEFKKINNKKYVILSTQGKEIASIKSFHPLKLLRHRRHFAPIDYKLVVFGEQVGILRNRKTGIFTCREKNIIVKRDLNNPKYRIYDYKMNKKGIITFFKNELSEKYYSFNTLFYQDNENGLLYLLIILAIKLNGIPGSRRKSP